MGMWIGLSNETYPSPIIQRFQARSTDLNPTFWHWHNNRMKGSCSSRPDTTTSDTVNERSTCPWTWKMNYDSRRLPSLLFEADCVCDKSWQIQSMEGFECGRFECEPIFYRVRVLRFDENCRYYKATHETISVACVAVVGAAHEMIRGDLTEVSPDWTLIPY